MLVLAQVAAVAAAAAAPGPAVAAFAAQLVVQPHPTRVLLLALQGDRQQLSAAVPLKHLPLEQQQQPCCSCPQRDAADLLHQSCIDAQPAAAVGAVVVGVRVGVALA